MTIEIGEIKNSLHLCCSKMINVQNTRLQACIRSGLRELLEQVQDTAGVEGVVLVRDLRHGLQERRRAALRGSGHAHGLGQGQRLLHLQCEVLAIMV